MTELKTQIPPEILAKIGRAAFGDQWKIPMAKALEVDPRKVRIWAKDGAPRWVAETMHPILRAKWLALIEADTLCYEFLIESRH